jgi:hypothetical protein
VRRWGLTVLVPFCSLAHRGPQVVEHGIGARRLALLHTGRQHTQGKRKDCAEKWRPHGAQPDQDRMRGNGTKRGRQLGNYEHRSPQRSLWRLALPWPAVCERGAGWA